MLYLFVVTQMSEDLVKQLSSYKAQLQQVEVALSTDPENEDLLKLQKDLQVCVFTWMRYKRWICLLFKNRATMISLSTKHSQAICIT